VSRELDHQEEYDVLTEKRTLAYTLVAQDGIAAVVNENNPVGALTMYQLRNIFEGQTTNWEQLGVAAEEILVISREDGSGTRTAFEEQVMRGGHVTSTALIMPSSKALHDYVAQSVGAIGYLSLGYPRSGVVPLMIDDVRPERQAVEQGTYPTIRPFLLVSRADPEPEVAAFMQYARSLPAQAIVRQTHGGARNSAVR
jgi:phosphate transport system substrate-binding protein